jgi:hypothetical protein
MMNDSIVPVLFELSALSADSRIPIIAGIVIGVIILFAILLAVVCMRICKDRKAAKGAKFFPHLFTVQLKLRFVCCRIRIVKRRAVDLTNLVNQAWKTVPNYVGHMKSRGSIVTY